VSKVIDAGQDEAEDEGDKGAEDERREVAPGVLDDSPVLQQVGQQHASEAEQGPGRAHLDLRGEERGTHHVAKHAAEHVDGDDAVGAVGSLEGDAHPQLCEHVHGDVSNPHVQEDGGEKAPPLARQHVWCVLGTSLDEHVS